MLETLVDLLAGLFEVLVALAGLGSPVVGGFGVLNRKGRNSGAVYVRYRLTWSSVHTQEQREVRASC
jgi:hypothetical protein